MKEREELREYKKSNSRIQGMNEYKSGITREVR